MPVLGSPADLLDLPLPRAACWLAQARQSWATPHHTTPFTNEVVQLVRGRQLLQALCKLWVELSLGLAHLALMGFHAPERSNGQQHVTQHVALGRHALAEGFLPTGKSGAEARA